MALKWFGDAVEAKVEAACRFGIDKTMSEATALAKSKHEWVNRTGIAEGSVRIVHMADSKGATITGRWGSVDVKYVIFLELGTSTSGPTVYERAEAAGGLGNVEPPVGPRMRPYPFLRPAADTTYPRLASNIRVALAEAR